MNARVVVDGKELKLNRFIQDLTGNLIDGMARSLKSPNGSKMEFRIRGENLSMFVDDQEVSLNLGHASRIIGDVLKGLLKNLYGAENAGEVSFICEKP